MKEKDLFPESYPTDLNECLKFFEGITYESYGFGIVWLCYNYSLRYWSMDFRNPANFKNPEIKAESPIEACYQMLDFLKDLYEKGRVNQS